MARITLQSLINDVALGESSNLSDVDNPATALTNLGVSGFAQTILDDANAAAVRTTLGLDSVYQKIVNPIFMPSRSRFFTETGTPSPVVIGSTTPAQRFPDSASTVVVGNTQVPTGATTVAIDLVWAPSGTAAGNFRIRCDYAQFGDAETITGFTTGTAQTVASPAIAGRRQVTTMETGITMDPTKELVMRVVRLGSDAADTSTDGWDFIGARVRPS